MENNETNNSKDSLLLEVSKELEVLKDLYRQLLERHSAAQNFIDKVRVYFTRGEFEQQVNQPESADKPMTQEEINRLLIKCSEFLNHPIPKRELSNEFHHERTALIRDENVMEEKTQPEEENEDVTEDMTEEEMAHLLSILADTKHFAEQVRGQSKMLVKRAARLC